MLDHPMSPAMQMETARRLQDFLQSAVNLDRLLQFFLRETACLSAINDLAPVLDTDWPGTVTDLANASSDLMRVLHRVRQLATKEYKPQELDNFFHTLLRKHDYENEVRRIPVMLGRYEYVRIGEEGAETGWIGETDPDAVLIEDGDEPGDIPVSIYLSKGSQESVAAIKDAVGILVRDLGFEMVPESDPIIGSWWQRFRAKVTSPEAKDAVLERIVKLERAAEVKLLGLPESQANENNANALATLLTALKGEPSGVVQIGSLLLVKIPNGPSGAGAIFGKTLTIQELRALEKNPALLADPIGILDRLPSAARAIDISTDDVSVEDG